MMEIESVSQGDAAYSEEGNTSSGLESNLNPAQRQVILDRFNQNASASVTKEALTVNKAWVMTEEALAELLVKMLDYAIDGSPADSKDLTPEMRGWIPSIKVESTFARRDQYLQEFNGDAEKAVEAAIQRSHGMARKMATTFVGYIPVIGALTSYSFILWHQLREVALIAALYGHDLKDPQVKMKILGALLQGNVMKIPAQSVDIIAKMVMKQVLLKAGVSAIPGASIPAHLIFNYFTDNSAKVSTYAKAAFKDDE